MEIKMRLQTHNIKHQTKYINETHKQKLIARSPEQIISIPKTLSLTFDNIQDFNRFEMKW